METICIMCPMGCPLNIEKDGDKIAVTGNTCKRGETYGIEEFTHPRRSVTTLVRMQNGGVASVKTSNTIPKERIFDVINEIGKLTVSDKVKIGDIVAYNVLGLGADVVVTGRP